MKHLFSTALILSLAVQASAESITPDQAAIKAEQFFATTLHRNFTASEQHSRGMKGLDKASTGASDYYIVNNTAGGWVIVSGDDRAYDILAYSPDGTLAADNIPAPMQEWLQMYASEMTELRTSTARRAAKRPKTYNAVAPLLGDIAWDQLAPYNCMTPMYVGTTHAATGCVATALAQVMRYHKWPAQGRGQHSYIWQFHNNEELSIDFSQSTYDWENMLPNYSLTPGTQEQQDAVALLMRDCGYAVEMQYWNQSGSMIDFVPPALINFFDYDTNLGLLRRRYYTQTEWDDIIRGEIAAQRPVYSTGFTEGSGGHAYVFDGYDAQGLIHVNWGWSGMSNGYFRTSALTPPTQGTGGSAGGFNTDQSIVVGIQQPTEGTEPWLLLATSERMKANPATATRQEPVQLRITGKTTNYGWLPVDVDLAIAIADMDGNRVFTQVTNEALSLAVSASKVGITASGLDLSSLAPGNYKVYPCARSNGGTQWTPLRHFNANRPNYLFLEVTADSLLFTSAGEYSLQARDLATTPIYRSINSQATAVLVNDGLTEFSGNVKAALLNEAGTVVATGDNYKFAVAAGDTLAVALQSAFNVEAGNYRLTLIDDNYTQLAQPLDVTVQATPSVGTAVQLVKQLSFANNAAVDRNNMTLDVTLQCTQGVYASNISAYIYDETGTSVVGSYNPSFAFVEAGQTVTVPINAAFENGIEGRTYIVRLIDLAGPYYLSPTDLGSCTFTLGSAGNASDVNGDGTVDVTDVNMVINTMLGKAANDRADVNGDGTVDVTDVNMVINTMLGK